MKGVRALGAGAVSVCDLPLPEPARGEVLVRVAATGLCATDRKAALRQRERSGPTLGHEVTGWLPDGTAIGIHPEVACRDCLQCRDGWHNRCPRRQALGLDRDGGLAELLAVPAGQAVPLDELDPVVATMLEPLACAVHAVMVAGQAGYEAGRPALVVGAGTMGILCTWVLQAAGARVAVAQRSFERRRLAGELGADAAIGPDDDPAGALGAEPAAVFVTAPGADPLRWALARVGVGGVVHAFAGTPGGAEVDANPVHYRHLRLVGSTGSRLTDYRRARDLVASGQIRLDRLPYQVVGLAEAPAAVLAGPAPGTLKVVVQP